MRLSLVTIVVMLMSELTKADDIIKKTVDAPANTLQTLFGLTLVVVAIFAVTWLIKRMNYAGHQVSNFMKIKGSLYLSPKEKLVLVDIAGEQVVIGVAPGVISHIKTLSEPIENNCSAPKLSSVFSEKFNTFIKNNRHHEKTEE